MRFALRLAGFVAVSLSAVSICSAKPKTEPYTYKGDISFDIARIPFSRFGSYLTFSAITDENAVRYQRTGAPRDVPGVYLRSVHGDHHPVFRIELLQDGTSVPFRTEATPSRLRFVAQKGTVEICISRLDKVRFRADGVALKLIAPDEALPVFFDAAHWEINSRLPIEKYMLSATRGHLHVDTQWNGIINQNTSATFIADAKDGISEGEIDTYPSVWRPSPSKTSIEEDAKDVEREYTDWLKRMPEVPREYGAGAELAAYINWTSVVEADGLMDRRAMLMSKNWMAAVWSWDQCFNAMELSLKDPQLGWDQLMLPFDHQLPEGALPDMIKTSSTEINFTKPPIHGWTLIWMMRHGGYSDRAHLLKIYEPLARWTNWYFQYRDLNHDGLPEYNHGYDSGWDNATDMAASVPVETADLDAFLVLQMDALAEIAGRLGKDADRDQWKSRADQLTRRLIDVLWKGDHFAGIRITDGSEIHEQSLLSDMPIVLGMRLPAAVRNPLIKDLQEGGRFRTAHGFATQAPASKAYEADGYWRGPIWPPTTMLVAEGLDASGEHAMARKVREDFCKMAQQNNGMYENFDALTGEGLRDAAYTWSSSVYLIFAHQLWADAE